MTCCTSVSRTAAAVAAPLGNEAERHVIGRACVLGGLQMHGPLFVVPAGFEHLHQIARGHDFNAKGTDQFDGAGIDARDVRIGVARHVLHGDGMLPLHQRLHAGLEFLPAQIELRLARQMIESVRFDAMEQLARLALGRMK